MKSKDIQERLRGMLELEKRMGSLEYFPFEPAKRVSSPKLPEDSAVQNKSSPDWKTLQKTVQSCEKCRLAQGRKNTVFGEGSLKAKLMFIGEAPGADEDEQGRPFIGRAGQLLAKIIESIGMTRDEVYICNVIKCRPPENRTPLPDEIRECTPYLEAQIGHIRPKIICTLGSPAAKTVIGTEESITKIRGQIFNRNGITVIPTYHPAYLLRNPAMKRPVWEDMKLIKKMLAS